MWLRIIYPDLIVAENVWCNHICKWTLLIKWIGLILSSFDYGHASVRLHCVSWSVLGQFMTSGLSCSPLHVQDGHTALFFASSNGHDQIVELLLRREANVNHQTKVSLFMLVCVCVCSFTRSVIFFNVKYTCITMKWVHKSGAWQQIRVQTPGHNLDSIKLVSVF